MHNLTSQRLTTVALATGGIRSRDAAEILHLEADALHGEIGSGAMFHLFDQGGPLDAPEYMPAGSVDSRTVRNWMGVAIVAPTEIRREA